MFNRYHYAVLAVCCSLLLPQAVIAKDLVAAKPVVAAAKDVREGVVRGTSEKIRYQVKGRRAVIGDMVLGDAEDIARNGVPNLWQRESTRPRAGVLKDAVSLTRPGGSVTDGVAAWPNNTVYYEIDASLNSAKAKQAISDGMSMISNASAIKFVPRTKETHYISFFAGKGSDDGCWSYVGMQKAKQQLSLSDGCHYSFIAAHEIMHALGWQHEQSRPDRDKYVKIHFENIESGNAYNFDKLKNAEFDSAGPFDYYSIMMYDSKAFSTNGKVTIEPLDKSIDIKRMGNSEQLTAGDIKSLNLFYPGSSSSSSSAKSSSSASSKSSAKSSSSVSSKSSASSASSKSSAKSSSSSASSKASSSSSSSAGGLNSALKITYRVTDDWGAGFCANLRVTNTSAQAITAWRGSFILNDAQVRRVWNANLRQTGNVVSVVPAAYLSNIAAGETVKRIWFCARR